MAQGDVNNPNAWNSGTPTLGTGAVGAPQPQGGIAGDAPAPTDPDRFIGSFTLKSVPSALALGTVASPTGKGDVGDIEGFPDLANNSQVKGLAAFTTGAPTLVTQATTTPTGKGDVPDVGMSPTPKNEWNDSAGGTGTLTSWSTAGAPTLGLGTVTHPGTQGDIDAIYSPNEHFAGLNPTWANNTPTMGVGTITLDTDGDGDITDPFAWQDAIFFLTSQLYPLLTIEHVTETAAPLDQPQYTYNEHVLNAIGFLGGTFTTNLLIYSNWPIEHVQEAANFTAGTLILGLVTYGNWPIEHVQEAANFTAGTLVLGLITYSNWPTEHVQEAANLTAGTLT